MTTLWSVLEYLSTLNNFLKYRLLYDFSSIIFVDIKLAEGELLQLTKRKNKYQCSWIRYVINIPPSLPLLAEIAWSISFFKVQVKKMNFKSAEKVPPPLISGQLNFEGRESSVWNRTVIKKTHLSRVRSTYYHCFWLFLTLPYLRIRNLV